MNWVIITVIEVAAVILAGYVRYAKNKEEKKWPKN